jgi:hypothetical protein
VQISSPGSTPTDYHPRRSTRQGPHQYQRREHSARHSAKRICRSAASAGPSLGAEIAPLDVSPYFRRETHHRTKKGSKTNGRTTQTIDRAHAIKGFIADRPLAT